MKYIIFIVLMLGAACLVLLFVPPLPTAIAFLVLISAVALDFWTTYRCLKKNGREGNPVIAFLFKKVGVFGTFGIMVGIWALFITLRWLPSEPGIQTAVAFAYWLVPVNNLAVLRRLSRKNPVRC